MTLSKVRITSVFQPEFDDFWQLYTVSFPEIERKTQQTMELALTKNQFVNEVYYSDGRIIALMSYWLYPEFCYLEYIAVNPIFKGSGVGTEVLGSLLKTVDVTIIGEIEHVVDETTMRRQSFYLRMGFFPNPQYNHCQPPYQTGFEELPMLLMTAPRAISQSEYIHFKEKLRSEIVVL